MKKVLIISYYWPPSGGAGVQRWLKFVKYLPEYGIDPVVLTVDPDYATYPQKDFSLEKDVPPGIMVFKTRSFEALSFVGRIFGRDKVPYGGFSNVEKRSPLQVLLRFLRGNFFIPDARIGWNRHAVRAAREILARYRIPTVITTGPPHSTHLIGMKLKREPGIDWIADFRDPWTDIFYYGDMLHTPLAKSIDMKKERAVIEKADRIITNCRSNMELLLNKSDLADPGKFSVITNGFDEDDFMVEVPNPDRFIITYTGSMSDHYRPAVFFRALSAVRHKNPDIQFVFRVAGSISASIEKELSEHGLDEIFEYAGYIDHDKLTAYLKGSSALLYIFPEAIMEKGIAGKLFEYLAARRPVIAIGSTESDASAIIRECEAGESFTRDEYDEIRGYIEDLVEKFRQGRGMQAGNNLHQKYSRRKLTSRLAGLINSL